MCTLVARDDGQYKSLISSRSEYISSSLQTRSYQRLSAQTLSLHASKEFARESPPRAHIGYEDVLYDLESWRHDGRLDLTDDASEQSMDSAPSLNSSTADLPQAQSWLSGILKQTDRAAPDYISNTNDRLKNILVEELLRWLLLDESNVNLDVFLLTFRKFTTSEYVLEVTIKEYNSKHPIDYKRNQKVQKRILVLLRKWLQTYPDDFCVNSRLNIELRAFLTIISWDDPSKMMQCRPLLMMLWGLRADGSPQAGEEKLTASKQSKVGYLKNNKVRPDLLHLSSQEIARMITEQDLIEFSALKPLDLLSMSNSLKFKFYAARVAKLTEWVATAVINCEKMKKRIPVVKKFIKIGKEFHKIGNYNGLNCILNGLQYPSITGLHAPWTDVGDKHIALLRKLCACLDAHKQTLMQGKPFASGVSDYNDSNVVLPSLASYVSNMGEFSGVLEGQREILNNFVDFSAIKRAYAVVSTMESYRKKDV